MTESLAGKVCLITGGARGQGEAEGRLFASHGAHVHLVDVLDAEGEALAEEIRSGGGQAHYHHMDVTSESDWQGIVDTISASDGRLDVLVNNAGIGNGLPLMSTSLESWNKVVAVNLTGPYLGIRLCAPLMRASGGGSIVNIGSLAAFEGYPGGPYTPTKWGVRGLTKLAAMELASWGIRVNAVHPGLIHTALVPSEVHRSLMTELTPLARAGTTDEIAQAVFFLATDSSSYISGADLNVDGGFSAGAASWRVAHNNGYMAKRPE